MLGSLAGPALRGTAAAQQDVAAAATATLQALGGVAAVGEIAHAARRGCSRRRAQSLPHNTSNLAITDHLSILPNPDTSTQNNVKTDDKKSTESSNRWQWKVELEDMRKQWGEMEVEKEKWKRDAEYLNNHMDTMIQTRMRSYMDSIDKQISDTKQKIEENAKEDNRLLQLQAQKLQGLNDELRGNNRQNKIDVDNERQLQSEVWKIEDPASAQLVERRTDASQSHRRATETEYHNFDSQASNINAEQDKYNDEQALLVIRACSAGLKQVIIDRASVLTTVAMASVGSQQLQRVSKVMDESIPSGLQKFTEIGKDAKELENIFGDAVGMTSNAFNQVEHMEYGAGTTPTRRQYSNHSTPLKVSDGGDDFDPDAFALSAFSVIK